MKPKPILTALAVAIAALVQPALAEWTFDKNGEPTHHNGVALPPIQTVEQARVATEKRLAAIHAEEAKQAADESAKLAACDTLPATALQELFYTGKPYLEETGQYVFLFRHYDPELGRWTTSDPSGFPDGANNIAYMAVPTSEFDYAGLKSIAWVYYTPSAFAGNPIGLLNANVNLVRREMIEADAAAGSLTHYLDDGDIFHSSILLTNSITGINNFLSTYERVVLFAHGSYFQNNYYWGGENSAFLPSVFGENASNIIYATCYNGYSPNPVNGATGEALLGSLISAAKQKTKEYLLE